MAIHESDIIKAKESLNISDKSLPGLKTGAALLQATAVYTVTGTETDGDIIELAEVPAGAAVIPQLSYAAFGNPYPFGTARVELGDGSLADRYGALYMAANSPSCTGAFGYREDAQYLPQPYAAPTRIQARLTNLDDPEPGGKIVFGVAYRI